MSMRDEVRQWQNRPRESLYPIVYMDWMPRQGQREPASDQHSRLAGVGRHDGGAEGTAGHGDVGA